MAGVSFGLLSVVLCLFIIMTSQVTAHTCDTAETTAQLTAPTITTSIPSFPLSLIWPKDRQKYAPDLYLTEKYKRNLNFLLHEGHLDSGVKQIFPPI